MAASLNWFRRIRPDSSAAPTRCLHNAATPMARMATSRYYKPITPPPPAPPLPPSASASMRPDIGRLTGAYFNTDGVMNEAFRSRMKFLTSKTGVTYKGEKEKAKEKEETAMTGAGVGSESRPVDTQDDGDDEVGAMSSSRSQKSADNQSWASSMRSVAGSIFNVKLARHETAREYMPYASSRANVNERTAAPPPPARAMCPKPHSVSPYARCVEAKKNDSSTELRKHYMKVLKKPAMRELGAINYPRHQRASRPFEHNFSAQLANRKSPTNVQVAMKSICNSAHHREQPTFGVTYKALKQSMARSSQKYIEMCSQQDKQKAAVKQSETSLGMTRSPSPAQDATRKCIEMVRMELVPLPQQQAPPAPPIIEYTEGTKANRKHTCLLSEQLRQERKVPEQPPVMQMPRDANLDLLNKPLPVAPSIRPQHAPLVPPQQQMQDRIVLARREHGRPPTDEEAEEMFIAAEEDDLNFPEDGRYGYNKENRSSSFMVPARKVPIRSDTMASIAEDAVSADSMSVTASFTDLGDYDNESHDPDRVSIRGGRRMLKRSASVDTMRTDASSVRTQASKRRRGEMELARRQHNERLMNVFDDVKRIRVD